MKKLALATLFASVGFSFALLLTIVGISSCKTSDPTPVSFLTVTLKSDYGDPDAKYWAFISDKNGSILDTQPLGIDTAVTLKARESDAVVLTIFGAETFAYNFHSYVGLTKNSAVTLTYQRTNVSGPLSIGSAEITIPDYPMDLWPNQPHVSDGFTPIYSIQYGSTYDASLTIKENHNDILVSGFRDENPVYTWFNDVTDGQKLTRGLSEFTPFEKTIPLDFEGDVYGSLLGKNNVNDFGYWLSELSVSRNGNPTVPKLGYLEGYPYYNLIVSSQYTAPGTKGGITTYRKLNGSLPTQILLPKYVFNVINPGIDNFAFSFTGTYDYKTSIWLFQPTGTNPVLWYVNSGVTQAPTFHEIPSAIKSAYPILNFETSQFAYQYTYLIKALDGDTYDAYLRRVLFIGSPRFVLEEYEFQYY